MFFRKAIIKKERERVCMLLLKMAVTDSCSVIITHFEKKSFSIYLLLRYYLFESKCAAHVDNAMQMNGIQ